MYVVESLPLPPAYLTVAASDYDEATLAWTDRTDAEEGFRVYRSTASGFAADGSTLIHTTAADVEEYEDGTGLLPGYRYYWRVATFSATGQQLSSEVTTVMPSRLGVAWVHETEAGLAFDATDGSTEVQYQTTLASDTGWTAIVDDATEIGDGLRFHAATGLTDETDYMARARERLAAGTWGAWHYASFRTVATPATVPLGYFTAPGDVVVSGTVVLRWDLDWHGRLTGWHATSLDVMALTTVEGSWTQLADEAGLSHSAVGSYAIDTTGYADGYFMIRLTGVNADGDEIGYVYGTWYVDNAGTAFDVVVNGMTKAEFEAATFSATGGAVYAHSSRYMDLYDEPLFGGYDGGVVARDDGIVNIWPDWTGNGVDGAYALVKCRAVATGTLFWWMNLQITGTEFGIDLYDPDDVVRLSFTLSIGHVWPIYPCDNVDNLKGGASLRVHADNHLRGTGSMDVQGSWPGECVVWPGPIMLYFGARRVAGTTDTFVVGAAWVDTWDGKVGQSSTTIVLDSDCAGLCKIGFRAGRGPNGHLGGVAQLMPLAYGFHGDPVVGCPGPLGEPPVESEPPEIETPCPTPDDAPLPATPGRPCAAHLTVYDDDRLTPLWMASTDPDDATADKILVEPDSYGEQEVDFAEGTASITAATVEVIDPPRTPGDQDTGLTTYRLVRDGITAMAGLRHRLLRWISESVGWVTIADGPGGFPRLGDSYSSYTTEIRDVRESERKLEAFTNPPAVVDECLGIVPRYVTIFPHGVTAPWGDIHGDGSEYLLDAVEPITAMHSVDLFGGGGTAFGLGHEIGAGLWHYAVGEAWPDYLVLTDDLREMGEARVVEATGQTLDLGIYGTQPLYRMEWPHLQIWWRYPGEEDWHVSELVTETATADAPTNLFGGHTTAGVVVVGYDEDGAAIREQRTVVESLPTFADWLGIYPDRYIPVGSELEFLLVYVGEATEAAPILIETTAGALLRQLYDGYWSPRDSDGAVVDPGIRYDATALDAMTQPVRLIMREIADDVRRWAEENVFKPLGFAPTLDQFGRIAPTSQRIDVDPATLITVGDAGIEPGPDWCAGDRVVNSVEFRYPRTWVVDGPDPDMELADFSGLVRESREVRVQERSDLSIARFGEERWETDGIACVALGNSDGTPLGLLADEWGWELAAERRVHVFGRWKFGTPYADLTCLRSLTATLRVGDWMIVEPSWMPSYATGERGITDGYAQIIAIADLDCSWRRLTVELVPASIALWGVSYETTAAFGAGAGLGAVALSSQSESTTAVLGAGGGMRTSTRAGSTATQSETTSGTFGAGAGSADT